MLKITLDAAAASKLYEVYQAAELCDPSGKVVGRFEPVFDAAEWEILGPPISDEGNRSRVEGDKRSLKPLLLPHGSRKT